MIRVTVIPDDEEIIVSVMREALGRGSRLIITSGGLGPTEDDLTLQALARALGRGLVPHPVAYRWVQEKYASLAEIGYVDCATMTPAREKMALLPEGAEPLFNEVGAAPGIVLRQDSTIVVCLPGVPDELRAIFRGPLQPVIRDLFDPWVTLEWHAQVGTGDESELAPLLQKVTQEQPQVYIKSRARGFGPDRRFLVTLSARGEGEEEGLALLEHAWRDLERGLSEAGIPVLALKRQAQGD